MCLLGSLLLSINLFGQDSSCFLYDFKPKVAVIPSSVAAVKPTGNATVTITLNGDTLGKISKYVFGNAIAAWYGSQTDPLLLEATKKLAPTLIRFPGGSWSDGYFWNKKTPTDVPDSIYDGTTYNSATGYAKNNEFVGHNGTEGWVTSTDQWYKLRTNTNVSEGLITVNYAYARYGTSKNPVAQAAHLAADWVRYDNGRTKFWEIGNENGGPWEYGWMIDTALNQDGQPQIISGELYGKHFMVFADSMKKAASEIGATIYIGGQVIANNPQPGYMWYFVDKDWNEGFFKEIGNNADFYVVHNYFNNSDDSKTVLINAAQSLKANIDYVKQDIINKNGYLKPIALTEYNMNGGSDRKLTSNVNGMQAVVLICELIKNNFGLGARWLLGGMMYGNSGIMPHPDFYYLSFLPKFYGDHAVSATSSNPDILSYASKFSSGETGMVVINTSMTVPIVNIKADSSLINKKYYIYTFMGVKDSDDFAPYVTINDYAPDKYQYGPYNYLTSIKAKAYTIDSTGDIKFYAPRKSVQMIMIEGKNSPITKIKSAETLDSFNLYQNIPNPSSLSTLIGYQLPKSSFVKLKVFDFQGREISTLVNEQKNAGYQSIQFNTSSLPSGIYYYSIDAGQYHATKKLVLIK